MISNAIQTLVLAGILLLAISAAEFKQPKVLFRRGSVIVIGVSGELREMGVQYGVGLRNELRDTVRLLTEHIPDLQQEEIARQSEAFARRSGRWVEFLRGIADGSGLSLEQVKLAHAMETLTISNLKPNISSSQPRLQFGCAFACVPGRLTADGRPMVGRNYDYPPPFDKISRNLVLTVVRETGKLATAIVGMPGQIYCPTCVNEQQLFLELNNGGASGGWQLDKTVPQSTLLNMLDISMTTGDPLRAAALLSETKSDYSLIVNVAGAGGMASVEFSTAQKISKNYALVPECGGTFVSTNFFLNPAWALPPPSDADTFVGVTRRNNLLGQLQTTNLTTDGFKRLMDKNLMHGGAKWALTIYQIIYDYATGVISLRSNQPKENWVDVDLTELFGSCSN